MFTGIIEELGCIININHENENTHFNIKAKMISELKIDQSIAHNGVCLTVINISDEYYTVTAIKETLEKTNLGQIKIGQMINLERSLKLGERLDGHMVQGHVDTTAICTRKYIEKGSWIFDFKYKKKSSSEITVEKGSITVNGISLTVVNSKDDQFSVCIIPYTYENTCFKFLEKDDKVNLEFDIIGKYITKILDNKTYF